MCCHVGTLTHVLQHPGGYMGLPKLTRQEPTARTMQSYIATEQKTSTTEQE
jgi:hypothetical protein